MLAISAAGTAVAYNAQRQQSKAVANAANASLKNQMDQLSLAQAQTNEQTSDAQSERARQAMVERGRLQAIFGESGMQGLSADRIFGESYFNEGTDIASLENDRQNKIQQLQLEKSGASAQYVSRVNSAPRPSALTAGLQIAGSAASLYAQSRAKDSKAGGNI